MAMYTIKTRDLSKYLFSNNKKGPPAQGIAQKKAKNKKTRTGVIISIP